MAVIIWQKIEGCGRWATQHVPSGVGIYPVEGEYLVQRIKQNKNLFIGKFVKRSDAVTEAENFINQPKKTTVRRAINTVGPDPKITAIKWRVEVSGQNMIHHIPSGVRVFILPNGKYRAAQMIGDQSPDIIGDYVVKHDATIAAEEFIRKIQNGNAIAAETEIAAITHRPEIRFYYILRAFQQFGGAPVKAIEAARRLSSKELTGLEIGLRRIEEILREDFADSAEIVRLANNIKMMLDAALEFAGNFQDEATLKLPVN